MSCNDDTKSRTALPLLEHALLWSIRAWAVGQCQNVDVASRIGRVFEQLHVPEAAGHLDGFMWVLSRGATRALGVNCVCNTDVSADESALLDVFALQQEGHEEQARAVLQGMMPRGPAIAGCHSASRLSMSLGAAGQLFSRGQAALQRQTRLQTAMPGAPARSSYLH